MEEGAGSVLTVSLQLLEPAPLRSAAGGLEEVHASAWCAAGALGPSAAVRGICKEPVVSEQDLPVETVRTAPGTPLSPDGAARGEASSGSAFPTA